MARAALAFELSVLPLVPIGPLNAAICPVHLTVPLSLGERDGAFGARPLIPDWMQANYKSWPLYLPLTGASFSQLQSSSPFNASHITHLAPPDSSTVLSQRSPSFSLFFSIEQSCHTLFRHWLLATKYDF